MDLEKLVIAILDRIEEANDDKADGLALRFNKEQIQEIADAWREVEHVEIY